MSSEDCQDCTFCMFTLLAFIMLAGGITTMIMSEGQMWIVAIIIFAIAGIFAYMASKRRTQLSTTGRVVGIARGHEQISVQELAELAGVNTPKASDALYGAIASGKINGTIRSGVFYRSESSTGGVRTIEREVMVTRKVPENCFKCGAPVDPKEVEWVGPDSVRCTHCGAIMSVKTERL